MSKPAQAIDCWFVGDYELEGSFHAGKAYEPYYRPYAYCEYLSRHEDTLEVKIGRRDQGGYHCDMDTRYDYFVRYKANQKVYITLDKLNFYYIKEIVPIRPMLFILERLPLPAMRQALSLHPIAQMAHPIHFEDLGGAHFERIVLAFLNEVYHWESLNWMGESGSDGGRDLWGKREQRTYCFQCANYRMLSRRKAVADIEKLLKNSPLPDQLIVICGGRVSERTRSSVVADASKLGIRNIELWTGRELEEKLRKSAPDTFRRFFG